MFCAPGSNTESIALSKTSSGHKSQQAPSLVSEAPISDTKTSGMCAFKCSNCPSQYYGWGGFYNHMKNEHKKHIKMSEHEVFLTKIFAHICRICSEKVLCDSDFLSNHLRKRHKFSMSKYRDKYNIKKVEETTTRPIVAEAPVSKTETKDKCIFKCSECSTEYRFWQGIYKHMKNQHEIHIKWSDREIC